MPQYNLGVKGQGQIKTKSVIRLKPIRSTIFNFDKIVNDLDIDFNTPAS